jgi:hypothetical protein
LDFGQKLQHQPEQGKGKCFFPTKIFERWCSFSKPKLEARKFEIRIYVFSHNGKKITEFAYVHELFTTLRGQGRKGLELPYSKNGIKKRGRRGCGGRARKKMFLLMPKKISAITQNGLAGNVSL